jgi:hypothetical protein
MLSSVGGRVDELHLVEEAVLEKIQSRVMPHNHGKTRGTKEFAALVRGLDCKQRGGGGYAQ